MDKYKIIFNLLARYKLIYSLIFVLSLIVAFLESINIAVILPFLNIFLGASSQSAEQGYLFTMIYKVLSFLPFENKLFAAAALLIMATIVKAIFKILNEFLISYASGTVLFDIKNKLINKYSKIEYEYFLNNKQGTLMFYVLSAPIRVAKLLQMTCLFMMELFSIVAIMIFLFTLNLYVSLSLVIMVFIFSGVTSFIAKKMSYTLGERQLKSSAEQSNILNEFITGIKHIRTYNASKRWMDFFNKQSKKYSNYYIRNMFWISLPANVIETTSLILLFATALFLKLRSPQTAVSYVPVIGIFGMAILKLLPSVRNAGRQRMMMWGLLPDAEAISNLLNSKISRDASGKRIFKAFKDSVRFKEVSFSYGKRKNKVLDQINFSIEKNKINAIVGASGSGKTTMINLLLRLFDPVSGEILVDGINLTEFKLNTWFDKVGFVSQEPFIFHSTIMKNITFDQNDYNTDSVVEAAKAANAHNFIMELPDQYQTVVGERGLKLSGGQQQRIAIARALIRKPEILILDEATSALDSISEKSIQEAILNASNLCTVIVIAHKLSTVKIASKILVLGNGRIAGKGTHEELIVKSKVYKELYNNQAV